MAGTLISKVVNGENGTTSFTNLQQSFLVMLRSYDGMEFGNYEAGNTSMINVLEESVVAVNYNLYKWYSAQTITVMAVGGAVSDIGGAADGAYYLVASVGADSVCTIYAMKCSDITVAANVVYSGWYVSGTAIRVLGGFTKTGASYSMKWRYQIAGGYANETADFSYRLYSDGVEGALRVNTDHISLYASTSTMDHGTTAIDFADFVASCPSRLVVPITAITLGANYESRFTSAYTVSLVALDRDGNELGVMDTTDFVVTGSSVTRNAVFAINPGRYKVRLTPKVITTTWVFNGSGTSTTLAVRTTAISAYLTEVYGARRGTY